MVSRGQFDGMQEGGLGELREARLLSKNIANLGDHIFILVNISHLDELTPEELHREYECASNFYQKVEELSQRYEGLLGESCPDAEKSVNLLENYMEKISREDGGRLR